MKKFYLVFFLLGTILAIILPVVFRNLNLFDNSRSINDITIEKLRSGNRDYSFKKGTITAWDNRPINYNQKQQVKQLVYFYLLTKEDPLFISPDLDISGLKNAVNGLRTVEDTFTTNHSKYPHLFPTSFLSSLDTVKQAEGQFLAKPGDISAENLLITYKQAAQKYQKDSSDFIKTIKNHQNEIPQGNLVFLKSVSSKKIILSDLNLLEKNASALKAEVDKRAGCLSSGAGCYRPAAAFIKPANSPIIQSPPKILSSSLLFVGTDNEEKKTINGPYLATGACFGSAEEFPYYVFKKRDFRLEAEENTFLGLKLASNNYFRHVARNGWENDFPKGYEWFWQRETMNYLCPDLSFEPRLATLDYFIQTYRQKPLLNGVGPAGSLEKSFFSSSMPSYQQASYLSTYYAFFYNNVSDQDSKEKLLQRYLIINRQLSNFPMVIKKIIYEWNWLFAANRKSQIINESNLLSSFYLPRSAWSLTYLTFSPSVWRLSEKPKFIDHRQVTSNNPDDLPYWDQEQIKSYYGKQDIKTLQELSVEYNNNIR
ncbi:MAG: hypothetical protein M1268_04685 [Patescibacteria group bacterium]|nr:hypothetical protein [Patescibacteria group bacterium]